MDLIVSVPDHCLSFYSAVLESRCCIPSFKVFGPFGSGEQNR